jgi:hypothetical protein
VEFSSNENLSGDYEIEGLLSLSILLVLKNLFFRMRIGFGPFYVLVGAFKESRLSSDSSLLLNSFVLALSTLSLLSRFIMSIEACPTRFLAVLSSDPAPPSSVESKT